MILCARNTSRSSEQSTKRRSRSENMWKVCLSVIITWLSDVADIFFEKFTKCAKAYGLVFSDSDWLSRQTLITWHLIFSCGTQSWKLVKLSHFFPNPGGICTSPRNSSVFLQPFVLIWRRLHRSTKSDRLQESLGWLLSNGRRRQCRGSLGCLRYFRLVDPRCFLCQEGG